MVQSKALRIVLVVAAIGGSFWVGFGVGRRSGFDEATEGRRSGFELAQDQAEPRAYPVYWDGFCSATLQVLNEMEENRSFVGGNPKIPEDVDLSYQLATGLVHDTLRMEARLAFPDVVSNFFAAPEEELTTEVCEERRRVPPQEFWSRPFNIGWPKPF